MKEKYSKSLRNIRDYIYINLQFNIDIDNFKIKDSDEDIEKESLHWLDNIEFYHKDYSFVEETVYFFEYKYKEIKENSDLKKDTYSQNNGHYMIYTSKDEVNGIYNIQDFIEEVDFNLGILLAMFLDEDYFPNIKFNLDMEYDVLNILDLDGEEYSYHEFKEIKKLFNNIKIFKIREEYLNSNNKIDNIEQFKFRVLGSLKCEKKLNMRTKDYYFSQETLIKYKEIFKSDINNFPYDNLYFSLSHNSPKYIFLEIYRMFEKIYPIVHCKELKKELNLEKKDLFEIKDLLNRKLGWRHDEKKSINIIFEYSEQIGLQQYVNELESYKVENGQNKNQKLGTWIYEIRNELVHLRFGESTIQTEKLLKDDRIIKNLISIIFKVYQYLF